jgi:hypothetical protein
MTKQKKAPSDWEQTSITTKVHLGLWTGAWVLSMAVATFGPTHIWPANDSLTIFAIVINLLLGFGVIVADIRHLRSLDELHQKVQLEAMAMALGVAVVVGLAYSNLDISNIIEQDAQISHLVLLIGFTYIASMFVGMRRYR